MPLDPLMTDETLDKAVKPEADTDTVMLWGCGSFVVASFAIFFIGVLPFFVIQDVVRFSDLMIATAVGLVPSTLVGFFLTRKRGIPAAFGTLGGFMIVGVFMHLRLQLAFKASMANQAATPEYPAFMVYLWPTLSLVVGILIAAIGYKVDSSSNSP